MKRIIIIAVIFLLGSELRAQNNIYEIGKADTFGIKLNYCLTIPESDLEHVERIGIYKKVDGIDLPVLIKEVYISPLQGYFLVDDQGNYKMIQKYFTTLFPVYKDEYSQITGLGYKLFFTNGESEIHLIPKP